MNIDAITTLLNDLEAGSITWEQPVRYHKKQKITDLAETMATARSFLVSVATTTELHGHDQAIQHEATTAQLAPNVDLPLPARHGHIL